MVHLVGATSRELLVTLIKHHLLLQLFQQVFFFPEFVLETPVYLLRLFPVFLGNQQHLVNP